VAPPVFKTGLAGITLAGRFDSFPPPPTEHRLKPVPQRKYLSIH